jgi:hypothetical protein
MHPMTTEPALPTDEDERKPLGWKVVAAAAVLLLLFGIVLLSLGIGRAPRKRCKPASVISSATR